MSLRLPAVVLLILFASASIAAADGEVKKSLKEAGEGFKKFGKKVGEAGKEVGHEVAEVAKKVWYKGKRVSKPLLDDVQKATRKFWGKVIEGKDRTIEKLRGENADLREELEEEEEDDE